MRDMELSSWTRRDLSLVISGQGIPPPSVLALDDGRCLFYRARANELHGEPEGGKSWIGFVTVAQTLHIGGRALYVDYEDDEHGVVERLRSLGVPDSQITGPNFYYIRPEEPLNGDFHVLLRSETFDVIVIDSTNEAMGVEGLDPLQNKDTARFTRLLTRPAVATGACVVTLDHVTKNAEQRGKWAIGAQQKRAMIRGASYSVENVTPFGRGCSGEARLVVTKDTPGHIRSGAGANQHVATFRLSSDLISGRVRYHLAGPAQSHALILDRLVAYIRVNPGASKRALRSLSNSDVVDACLVELEEAGIIRVERTGTVHAHFLDSEG